ncbi:MAG: hypothetical protein H6755_05955 [Candidatus Omnitrophica bacterium]|nr:hypothetical protein [Candidatus Omnitrophota bacterium]
MRGERILSVILAVALLSGCTTVEKSAAIGGLSGAVVGGVVGHQYDDGVKGAAIGGLGGTYVGMHLGKGKKQTEYEKGFEAGYKQGQADYAKDTWDQQTGRCGGKQGGE